jgi:hypothetical protein
LFERGSLLGRVLFGFVLKGFSFCGLVRRDFAFSGFPFGFLLSLLGFVFFHQPLVDWLRFDRTWRYAGVTRKRRTFAGSGSRDPTRFLFEFPSSAGSDGTQQERGQHRCDDGDELTGAHPRSVTEHSHSVDCKTNWTVSSGLIEDMASASTDRR